MRVEASGRADEARSDAKGNLSFGWAPQPRVLFLLVIFEATEHDESLGLDGST